jgi:hypothetical protein
MGTTVLQGSGAFTLNAGATLECANAGGLDVTLSNTGAKNLFADANFIYDGTASQVTGTILPAILNNLTINNTAGVTLSSPSTVNGTLSTLSGDLTLNSNILTIGSLGVLSESAGNTVLGKVVTSRLVAQAVNNTFGGIGIEINAAGVAPGTTDAERVTGIAQTGNGKTSILRYFKITPVVNAGLNATFVFKFDNSELAGQDANVLKLFSSQDDGVYWVIQGGTSNASERKITLSGVNNFSSWTAADTNNNIGSGTTFAVSNAWNMISVPVTAPDYRKIKLFPDAQSNAFPSRLCGEGYFEKWAWLLVEI